MNRGVQLIHFDSYEFVQELVNKSNMMELGQVLRIDRNWTRQRAMPMESKDRESSLLYFGRWELHENSCAFGLSRNSHRFT